MSVELTTFVDVLPLDSLKTCLSLVKGETITKRAAALAALNISSYAAGQFLPADEITIAMTSAGGPETTMLSLSECEAILTEMLPDASGTISAKKIGDGKMLEVFKTLLPLLLKFLL